MANGGDQNQKVADEALKGDDCDCHPEFLPPPSQPPRHKGKQKSRNNESEKPSSNSEVSLQVDLKSILEKQFSKSSRAAHQDFANIMKMLRSLIQAPDGNSCEICHEIFKSKNMRVLKCGHKFHKGCFKQWLKGQSTCPTCGSSDLLSEE